MMRWKKIKQRKEGKGWHKENSGEKMHNTGTSVATLNANRVNNIWDMAGNAGELTTENTKYSGEEWIYTVYRGGQYDLPGSGVPAAYREHINPDYGYYYIGFRCVLYK